MAPWWTWCAVLYRVLLHGSMTTGGLPCRYSWSWLATSLLTAWRPAGAANFRSVSVQLAKRYWRLLAPFLVALTAALAAASLARTWHHPDSVPAAASIGAVIAHLLMLQDLLGVPGLSAGVWYLSIDLQLFACTVLILAVAPWLAKHLVIVSAQHLGIALVLGLTCVSLVWLNRIPALDATALYFYGAYGMGMLTCWGVRTNTVLKRRAWFCMVSALVVAALAVDFRGRLLFADWWPPFCGLAQHPPACRAICLPLPSGLCATWGGFRIPCF